MKHFYEFGSFRLDKAERQLLRNGSVVSLTPKAFDTLLYLVEKQGHVLEKSELMKALWPESFVEEGNLTDNISKVRQALGDDRSSPQYIQTVARRGHRFIAAVQEVRDAEPLNNRTTKEEERAGSSSAIRFKGDQTAASAQVSPTSLASRWHGPAIIAGALVVGLILALSMWKAREPVTASSAIRSIAILPFKPLVESERDEVFELGMADTLITRLGRFRQLVVRRARFASTCGWTRMRFWRVRSNAWTPSWIQAFKDRARK